MYCSVCYVLNLSLCYQLYLVIYCRLLAAYYTSVYKELYIMTEYNTSFVELLSFEDFVPELEEVSEGQRKWIDEAKRELKCEDEDDLTADLFARPNKSVMSRWLEGARDIMCRQQQMLENFKDLVSTMKTEAIGDKSKVIKLQEKLLECKEEQLASLQTAVRATVQDSVKTEMMSYSDALKESSGNTTSAPAITPCLPCLPRSIQSRTGTSSLTALLSIYLYPA